jgi:hypothetical protein
MPYTNVHIFQEKVAKSFSKKKFEPLNFMKKIIQIKIIDFQPLENLAERITLGKSEFSFVLQTVDKTFCGKLYRAASCTTMNFKI